MKLVDDFRSSELAKGLIEGIRRNSTRKARLMEFCGGHTVAIMKHGIRQLLPPTIEMLSGPGCPVCVTGNADLDKAIALARIPEVIMTSFGDMLKVPGSRSSLQEVRAEGADVRMVYSTIDALQNSQAESISTSGLSGSGFRDNSAHRGGVSSSGREGRRRQLLRSIDAQALPAGNQGYSGLWRDQDKRFDMSGTCERGCRLPSLGFHCS